MGAARPQRRTRDGGRPGRRPATEVHDVQRPAPSRTSAERGDAATPGPGLLVAPAGLRLPVAAARRRPGWRAGPERSAPRGNGRDRLIDGTGTRPGELRGLSTCRSRRVLVGGPSGGVRTAPTSTGTPTARTARSTAARASGFRSGSTSAEFSGQSTRSGRSARPAATSAASCSVRRTWLSSPARRWELKSRPRRSTMLCTAATTSSPVGRACVVAGGAARVTASGTSATVTATGIGPPARTVPPATACSVGANRRQFPHQAAKNSTSTGPPAPRTSWSNRASLDSPSTLAAPALTALVSRRTRPSGPTLTLSLYLADSSAGRRWLGHV